MSGSTRRERPSRSVGGAALRSGRTLIVVFLVAAVAVALAGKVYYESQSAAILRQRESDLTAIRDLKSAQIAQWRASLLDDGNVILGDPTTVDEVDSWLASRKDGPSAETLRTWITALAKARGYASASIVAPDGSRWIANEPTWSPSPIEFGEVSAAVRSGETTLTELYLDPVDGTPRLDVVAPMKGGGEAAHAVVVLRRDPSRYLYPLIQGWPVPSASSETLILRRAGGDVVYLNDLRFHPSAALRFVISVANTQLLAVQALSGGARVVEGVDYREVPVVGAVGPIGGSDWFIVVKTDRSEVFAPIEGVFASTLLTTGLLLAVLGLGLVAAWRQNSVALLRERFTAEQAGQERLDRAVQGAPMPIMIHAEDGEVIMINAVWEELTGYSLADIPTTADWTEKAYGQRAPLVRDDIEALYGLTSRKEEGEYTIRRADGSERVWDFTSAPLGRLTDGRRLVMSTARDVTERKRADEQLAENAARLRALLDNAPYGAHLYELMPDGRLVFVGYNARAGEILGLDHQPLVGKTLEEAFPGNAGTETPDQYRRVAREGGTWSTEQYAYNDDHGIAGVFEVYAFSYGSDRVAVFFRDITDLKKAEIALTQRTQELERSNAELEKFAYVASHDLQEPLRMVASYTQLLQQRYAGRLDSDADEFIGYAVDGATRMRTLINDLLAYSRVGTRGSTFVETDLDDVLTNVLAGLVTSLQEVAATVTRDPLPTVRCDPTQIGQVFQNLISNAAKFHGDEAPLIHVGARREGSEWVFSVSDNGIGIDPQYFDRIFVIFQRLESRAKYPGTGIGLAICKRIIGRHGGRIWVESQPGAGSTFMFTLPAQGEGPHE